jgi:hypothetical protein
MGYEKIVILRDKRKFYKSENAEGRRQNAEGRNEK